MPPIEPQSDAAAARADALLQQKPPVYLSFYYTDCQYVEEVEVRRAGLWEGGREGGRCTGGVLVRDMRCLRTSCRDRQFSFARFAPWRARASRRGAARGCVPRAACLGGFGRRRCGCE